MDAMSKMSRFVAPRRLVYVERLSDFLPKKENAKGFGRSHVHVETIRLVIKFFSQRFVPR